MAIPGFLEWLGQGVAAALAGCAAIAIAGLAGRAPAAGRAGAPAAIPVRARARRY